MTPDKPDDAIDAVSGSVGQGDRLSLLSHDLRSALTDILGGLRLIDHDRLDTDTREHFDRIEAAGEVLARLLDKTLTDEAPHTEKRITRIVNLNLADFVGDIRKRWTARANEKGISFEIEKSASLPAIITLDRVTLERVISNLLSNAIKFTDSGEVTLSIASHADKSLTFRVRDNGPGFSKEALACLFEYEGRPRSTEKPGSGLGLFIAKELSDIMTAHLEVANLDGSGCEAVLRLPHDSWFDRSLRRDERARDSTSSDPVDLSGLRILLAEDNKTNQLVATQMLAAMGAEFAVASDGLEALDILEREEFDLALLDIEMPRMTGLELIKAVRGKAAPLRDLPLIALTAYVMREHRERIYGAGADGIIAKPVMNIQELGNKILEYMKRTKDRAIVKPAIQTYLMPAPNSGVVAREIFDSLIKTIGAESTAELLEKLQADVDSVAEGLGRGRKSLDLAEIRAQTHILVSVAGAIGAVSLQHIAQRLNAAANRKDAGEIDDLCRSCLSGLFELQGFIHDEQAKEPLLS